MQRTFHVSTNGDDKGEGTKRKPFATLARAVEAARQVKPRKWRRIVVHGGRYYDVAVKLGPEDSGLTIAAAEGDKPVLVGGRLVQNWKKDGKKFYAAELEGVKEGRWDFRMLLVNGRKRPRARLPEKGYFHHENAYRNIYDREKRRNRADYTARHKTFMNYRKGELGSWLDTNNAELTFVHVYAESSVAVKCVNTGKREVIFTRPTAMAPGHAALNGEGQVWDPERQRYWVSNIREGMHRPGQWYLDRTRGKLVYWPKPGEDMTTVKVIAPTTGSIIRIVGKKGQPVRKIAIKGLTLTVATAPANVVGFGALKADAAISARGLLSDLVFANLVIMDVGGHGIMVGASEAAGKAKRVRVDSCVVKRAGAGGIMVTADDSIVTNNLIREVGRDYRSVAGVMMTNGKRCEISHNEINGCPYNGVSANRLAYSRVAHNRITHYIQELRDGGAIYIGGGRQVTVNNNVAIRSRPHAGHGGLYGRHAYYFDSHCSKCLLEDNLAVNSRSPIHNTSSTDCVMRNNICVDRERTTIGSPISANLTFERNVIYSKKAIMFENVDCVTGWRKNVLYSQTGQIDGQHWDEASFLAGDTTPLPAKDGMIFADPLFVDVDAGDYRYRPDSPTRKLGIKQLDFSKAGRR